MLFRDFEEPPNDPAIIKEEKRLDSIRIKNMVLTELSRERFTGLDKIVENLFKIKNNMKLVSK